MLGGTWKMAMKKKHVSLNIHMIIYIKFNTMHPVPAFNISI
jgi:hypothetical protein